MAEAVFGDVGTAAGDGVAAEQQSILFVQQADAVRGVAGRVQHP